MLAGRTSGNEHLKDWGSYTVKDEKSVDRCGDRPGAKMQEAAPTQNTQTYRQEMKKNTGRQQKTWLPHTNMGISNLITIPGLPVSD